MIVHERVRRLDQATMNTAPLVSIVLPVKNGSGKLQDCLESLRHQDVPPETYEVIVADGRSTDNTKEIARIYGCRVVDNPRETVAGGRNAGLAVARGRYIAFSEDDIVLPPNWLSEGIRVLSSDTRIAAVGGPTPIPACASAFAKAVDLIFRAAARSGYSVQSGFHQGYREVDDIPGGNAMYRREYLGDGQVLDELLLTAEDVDLHMRLREKGHVLVFSPAFLAWHHKRDAPKRFFTQIRRFAQGRVQLWRRHKKALRPLHWACALVPVLFLTLSPLISWQVIFAIAIATVVGLVAVGLVGRSGLSASLWLPLACAIFLVAWPIGFFREFIFPTTDATGK